jgi:hypothetical protein
MRGMKTMGGYDSKRERGPKGVLFMGITPTHIPELLSLCKPSILLLIVPKENHLFHVRGWV